MPGIYIHIPFCKQACYYCNFHFSTSLNLKDEMMNALIKEINLSSSYFINDDSEAGSIETIYFGGGTPSLLNKNEIKNLLKAIKENYLIDKNAEVTLEANPDDINEEKLLAWKSIGINRLSIGVQSFKEKDLVWMNRAHDSKQASESISLAKKTGFDNFSVDLIYGIPCLTDDELKINFDTLVRVAVPHIACYALAVEPNTALNKMIILKKKDDINTDEQARQFLLLMQWMKNAGYEHYEISNFSKPGYQSRHNSSYWQGKKYLGIGPSAHSYDGKKRKWNVANNALYIQSIKNNIIPFEEEILTDKERLNEYIMISLRTSEGLDLNVIENKFSLYQKIRIKESAEVYINKKMMFLYEEKLILTNEGKLFADGIASELFFEKY